MEDPTQLTREQVVAIESKYGVQLPVVRPLEVQRLYGIMLEQVVPMEGDRLR